MQVSPFVMVIFGATGDLTSRKLIPSLYRLYKNNILPEKFLIVGAARREFSHEEFRALMRKAIGDEGRLVEQFLQNVFYEQGMFEDDALYKNIAGKLSEFDKTMGACITRFFYLATPPSNYSPILTRLKSSELSEGCGQGSNKWTRVLIEKPFGKDLNTALELEKLLSSIFEERQIYRIDHYLAKETLQNILFFRFANGMFEPLWNSRHIDHVQISLLEKDGIGSRAKFYEGVGAMRDTAQNHLMAMLAYTAMDEPESLSSEHVRKRRAEILSAVSAIDEANIDTDVVRGQYGTGNENQMVGYRQERGVDPNSNTETFVAMKLFVNTARWSGVPFYVRTGKRMKEAGAKIDVIFKNPENIFYKGMNFDKSKMANVLTIMVQPREGISLRFYAKKPGFTSEATPVDMDFSYERSFNRHIDDSYEKILLDSMISDQTLFATAEGFEATWKLITPILEHWQKNQKTLLFYTPGTNGPHESTNLLKKDGREWM